ncbi:MAG: DUF6036 family nucleotidyltransferase [Thermoanaerobaculia bacterium]
MATIRLPIDFAEFLRSLRSNGAEYLLVGGYAVGLYGYPRATADIDIWVRRSPENAEKVVSAIRAFGFEVPALSVDLLLKPDQVVRMGLPPLRIEVLTSVSGVEFEDCWRAREEMLLDGEPVWVPSLADLKRNKAASGRPKDLEDLRHLPGPESR